MADPIGPQMETWHQQILQSRSALLRVARARLRNADWAEDAVSETLLAAMEKPPDFEDAGRVRAWLFGTLRHKLMDQLRAGLRDAAAPNAGDVFVTAADAAFEPACPLPGPEQRAMQTEFVRALAHQLQRLPPKQAEAFMLTECAGQASAEVCAAMAITEGHLWVLVHRARSKLLLRLAHHR